MITMHNLRKHKRRNTCKEETQAFLSMLWVKLEICVGVLDRLTQQFFNVLDQINSFVFFSCKWVEPIPPIPVDFFYEGYRLPWLGVFTAFFIVHTLLFTLGKADPVLAILSVNLCKNEYFVSKPKCLNSISPLYVATSVDEYRTGGDDLWYLQDDNWAYLSIAGALIVGMANTKFHMPWWIFIGVLVECVVFYTYLEDLSYCPQFNGSFLYENTFNSSFYWNSTALNSTNSTYGEYDFYTRADALEFYEVPQCPNVANVKTALRNIFDATLEANVCICELYTECCGLVQNSSWTTLISAYYCVQSYNGTAPEESYITQSIISHGLSPEVSEQILRYEELGLLDSNVVLGGEIQKAFDVMLELGKWFNSISCSDIETNAATGIKKVLEDGAVAIECLCKLYPGCCGRREVNMTIPVYDVELEAVVMSNTEMNITVVEKWNCSDLCLASALKSKHDSLLFRPWEFWYNRLFMAMVVIRFLMILWLFIRICDKLFRLSVRCMCRKSIWKNKERRRKIECLRNLKVLKFQPISSRFMTSQIVVLVTVIYFHIISWYVVFFIVYCVTYQEIPTPFAGFTHSFTFNFGSNFEKWHWAVYLGGAILSLFVNLVFFGVYWMLIVGYQMLKRDINNVILLSEADDLFKVKDEIKLKILDEEQREISRFQMEMEGGYCSNTNRTERLKSLDDITMTEITRGQSMYHQDGSYEYNEIYSKEEIERYGYCTALKNMFFPFQDPSVENRTIYEDCLHVNPFLASAFPAIYVLFAITGLFILLLVVFVLFIILLFLILNLALVKPIFPEGYPLTRDWLLNTVWIFFFYVCLASVIANRYLMPKEGEWKQRIKLYQGVVMLDMFYLLTWGILKAWTILATIIAVDVIVWGFGRMAVWRSTLKPPFQLLDSKYSAYVAVVRAAMIAHHARKNPRILLRSTQIQRQNASPTIHSQSMKRGSSTVGMRRSTFANPLEFRSELEFGINIPQIVPEDKQK